MMKLDNYECDGQMSLLDFIPVPKTSVNKNLYKVGKMVNRNVLGRLLTMDDLENMIGDLLVLSTEKMNEVVRIEKIVPYEGKRVVICEDGMEYSQWVHEDFLGRYGEFREIKE